VNLFLACVLTVVIETPFLALFGWRSREELTIIVCANVVTNLLLNLSLAFFLPTTVPVIAFLESAAVLAEYAVYALAFGRSGKLFLLTLLANCLSYGLGLLIFSSVRG